MTTLEVKKNVLKKFVATIKNERTGAVIDLTQYSSVKFYMIDSNESVVINGATATFEDAANGQVSYTFVSADVDAEGEFFAYFLFFSGATKKASAPEQYFKVTIHDDLLA